MRFLFLFFCCSGFILHNLFAQPSNDNFANAIDVTSLINNCSADAAYTTIDATSDRNEGSCHNIPGTGPAFNVWFSFTAPSSGIISITIDSQGTKGSQRLTQVAIWESDGLTEVSCKRYQFTTEDVVLGATSLTPGSTYYITVDSYDTTTNGTFTLCLADQVDYDFYEGAIDVTNFINTCSPDATYTTIGASGDRNKGSCHNVSGTEPALNRWFSFTAPPSGMINITVDIGGTKGSQRFTQIAIWESDGLTEVTCKRYQFATEDVILGAASLTPGNTYYITVDTFSSGTFTLCLADMVDYDLYEGAIDITSLINDCSADAAYTTIGASGDRNLGSCHNTPSGGPVFNRWFSFTAPPSGMINITVDTGGAKGSQTRTQVAIWESDGITEVNCERFPISGDIIIGSASLTPGSTYYISIDSFNSNTTGTFTLCLVDYVDYDFYEGAILIPDINNWCSSDAAYTTEGGTPDRNKGSCHNILGTKPAFNRWFKFVATTTSVNITIDIGGAKGSQRYTQATIWESDGVTEVSCERYFFTTDDVIIGSTSLIPGRVYYITVDSFTTSTHGTFTLCIDDEPDYDFYEGAIEITDLNDWCSSDAEYNTLGATGDLNKGSCHNILAPTPICNRWFYFTAVSPNVVIKVDINGSKGSQTNTQLALWESDGITEVDCKRYAFSREDVSITNNSLIPGNTYYISVDIFNKNNSGSFTLCVDNIDQVYYSIADGPWDNSNNWSLVSHSGPAATTPPIRGDVAKIQGNHITVSSDENPAGVYLDVSNANTSIVINNSTLTVSGQFSMINTGNNFDGNISLINSANLIVNDDAIFTRNGGNNAFDLTIDNGSSMNVNGEMVWSANAAAVTNSTMTVNGTGTLSVDQDLSLNVSSGTKILHTFNDNSSLTVGRDITFTATADNQIEVELNNNSSLNIGRNFVRGTPAYGILDCNNSSTVSYNSSLYLQTLAKSAGSGTGDTFDYHNITINNTRITTPQVTAEGAVSFNGTFTLTDGIVQTTSSNIVMVGPSNTMSSGSSSSFIDGPIQKTGNQNFTFPSGDAQKWAPLTISSLSGDASTVFTAEYHTGPYQDITNYLDPDPNGNIKNVSSAEYWDLTNTGTASSANLTLHWKDQSFSGIDDYDDLRIAHYTGSLWENIGQDVIVRSEPGSITVSGVSSFSPFTFASLSNTQNPLPVDLIFFEAIAEKNTVKLSWATASEHNSALFHIQRSSDGVQYDDIAKVPSSGNSFEKTIYGHLDKTPLNGRSYYRLVQEDIDGKQTILSIKSVQIELPYHSTTFYPNPNYHKKLNIRTHLKVSEEYTFMLYDSQGKIVFHKKFEPDAIGFKVLEVVLPKQLENGVYIAEFSSQSGREIGNVIIQ